MRRKAQAHVEWVERRRFERAVTRALRRLPADVEKMLQNVLVVVEDEPPLQENGTGKGQIFGLYEGTPLTERGSGYHLVTPDKITIFRKPLEQSFSDPQELARQIRITVIHELSHHLGLEEDRIEELGWA